MSSGSHVAKPSRKPKAPAGSRAPAGFGKNVVLILILVVLLAVLAIIVNMLRTAEPAKYRHVPGDTTLPAATAAHASDVSHLFALTGERLSISDWIMFA